MFYFIIIVLNPYLQIPLQFIKYILISFSRRSGHKMDNAALNKKKCRRKRRRLTFIMNKNLKDAD
jgi:hypothetical protein